MKRLNSRSWFTPLLFFGICLLAFGLLIPWLGFYQDDWYQIWFKRSFGISVWADYYARERPFIAFLYTLTTPFLGTAPLNWQIFGLFTRWLAMLAAWWALRQYWPARTRQITWIVLLFGIYPGFRQQFASVIYSHYFLQLAIHTLTLGSMALAIKRPRWFWPLTALSLAGSVFSLFTSEYFFGMELLRPIFLWMILGETKLTTGFARLKQTLAHWVPYAVAAGGFLFWRIAIFKFPTYQPVFLQNPQESFMITCLTLVKTILRDVLEMGAYAWLLPLRELLGSDLRQPSSLLALGLALFAFIVLVTILLVLRKSSDEPISRQKSSETNDQAENATFSLDLLVLGIAGLFTAGLPFWFVGLPVDTDLQGGSRFDISFMLPASAFAAGLIIALVTFLQKHLHRRSGLRENVELIAPIAPVPIFALLVALAIGHHFQDANFYRQVHRSQATFFQQLAWRAPGLKPGTLILTNTFEEVLLSGDNSLTAALNWIYDPDPPFALEYMLFYIPSRLESKNLPGLEPGLPVVKEFRTTKFQGSTSEALVLYYSYPHCLRVLDPVLDPDFPRPIQMPKELKTATRISNLSQIIPDNNPPATLPDDLFKYRPDQDLWCYYYEKADLARQQSDWQAIVRLGDQAFEEGHQPSNTWELVPFIEGYALSGSIEQAHALTIQAQKENFEARWMTKEILCTTWRQIERQSISGEAIDSEIAEIRAVLECR